MSDVGGLTFDKDAVYIDIPDWKVGVWRGVRGSGGRAWVWAGLSVGGRRSV